MTEPSGRLPTCPVKGIKPIVVWFDRTAVSVICRY